MKRIYLLSGSFFIGLFVFAQEPRLSIPYGHKGAVTLVQTSPSGRYILTASRDSTAKLWDFLSGKLIHNFTGHSAEITAVCFSPNEQLVFTASGDKTIRIWSIVSGKTLNILRGHYQGVTGLDIDPKGKELVSASNDGYIKLWVVQNGSFIKNLDSGYANYAGVKYSSNGQFIAIGSEQDVVEIFRNSNKESLGHFSAMGPIRSFEFSPDNTKILIATEYSTVVEYSITNRIKKEFRHKKGVYAANYSKDGSLIITACADSIARIWDALSGRLLRKTPAHPEHVSHARFSPSGKMFFTAGYDNKVRIWQSNDCKLLQTMSGHTDAILSSCFTPNEAFFVTGSMDQTTKLWNIKSGKLHYDLKNKVFGIGKSSISPDGKMIMAVDLDGNVCIWDIKTNKVVFKNDNTARKVIIAKFSPDSKIRVLAYDDFTIDIIDNQTGVLLKSIKADNNIYKIEFSPDSKMLAVATWHVTIWRIESGEMITTMYGYSGDCSEIISLKFSPRTASDTSGGSHLLLADFNGTFYIGETKSGNTVQEGFLKFSHKYDNREETGKIRDAGFSPDGRRIIIASDKNIAQIWNIESWEMELQIWATLEGGSEEFETARMYPGSIKDSAEKNILITASSNNRLFGGSIGDNPLLVWETTTGKCINKLSGHSADPLFADFSPGGKYLISYAADNSIIIWEPFTWKMLFTLERHAGPVTGISFSSDGEKMVSSSDDGSFALWEIKTGKLLLQKFKFGIDEELNLIKDKYYSGSKEAAKQLTWIEVPNRVMTFNQADIRYNRPDKVLESIGCPDTALINGYKKAYYKRIKKLGIDTSLFNDGYSVPEADFSNRNTIDFVQPSEMLTLNIHGKDSVFMLDRFNVWINEVPIFGQRGINIRNKNSLSFDTSLTIRLSEGENRIETSVTNINGNESYRRPVFLNFYPEKRIEPRIYFIGIGIDKFSDLRYNLRYSVKDIEDLCTSLKKKYGERLIIDTLLNEQVTTEKVSSLKNKLLNTNINDKVIISYSGHGIISKNLDYYLSTYPMDFDNPEFEGLPYEALETLLDSIPARQKLLLIDACHSGEVDKEDLLMLDSATNSGNLVKGIKPVIYQKQEHHLGLKNSFELMQELFVNVSKGTGTFIISAAAGTQFALEKGDLKNGVFTYAILEAMELFPHLTVTELKTYVGKRVVELTKGAQQPTSRRELLDADWAVW